GPGPWLVAVYPAADQAFHAGEQRAPRIDSRRAVGLAALRPGVQHPVMGCQPGQCPGQRAVDVRLRPRHLAGASGDRACRRAPYRPAAQPRRAYRRWPAGDSLRLVDAARATPGVADGSWRPRSAGQWTASALTENEPLRSRHLRATTGPLPVPERRFYCSPSRVDVVNPMGWRSANG